MIKPQFQIRISLITAILILTVFQSSKGQIYKENALLWEISGNGLETPSYIFGIVKFIPKGDFMIPENVKSSLKRCKILSTETLLDHHAMHELNKAAHLEHHETLADYLDEDYYNKLENIFTEKLDVSKLKFNLVYRKFKPVMLSTTMTRLSIKDEVMFYEVELIKLAHEHDLLTMGLETVEREVAALEKFPLDKQVHALKHTIDNFDQQISDYNALIKSYKVGDLHKTLEYTMHPVEDDQDFEDNFVFERNKEWVKKMKSYMTEAPTFFAVCTSHLADEEGIINLLVKEGYTVRPLKSSK